ncbi:MAG: Alginate biosynthesis protein AlgA [Candidatus Anoxychlamydiales bacterium]|nr:Alginate biosynthesis protein AlgA [Candidatus Anoxychlamydiales bacterium]NGX36102.1 Alginate biosynthesis protein AlgA [Candidatus Anoxychlamydiales bacterium]
MDQNIEHKIYTRPWGTYQTLKISKTCQVKWIEVNPQSKLSLQKHKKRSEHWVIVKGHPLIIVDKMKKKFSENEHVFIPKEGVHRIENDTDQKVIIVEVQIGSYLGEDDIIRLEDVYGRS